MTNHKVARNQHESCRYALGKREACVQQCNPHEAEQTLKLLDSLEELADIQKAYTSADFPSQGLEQYRAAN